MVNKNSKKNLIAPFSSNHQPKKRGRKKGSKNWKTVFRRYLNQDFHVTKYNGEIMQVTAMDAIAIKMIQNAAATGDVQTCLAIMNRTDGLPKQAIETITKKPLQIEYSENALKSAKEDLEKEDNFETNIPNKDEYVLIKKNRPNDRVQDQSNQSKKADA